MIITVYLAGILLYISHYLEAGGNNSSSKFSLFLILFGAAFLAPLGIGFFATLRQEKREKLFKAYAGQNNWIYKNFWEHSTRFPQEERYRIFRMGKTWASNEVYNLAIKNLENDGGLFLFDCYYEKLGGKYPVEGKATVLGIQSPSYNFPYFALYQEGLWSSVGEFFGSQDIDFSTHPNFSSRCKLTAENEAAARQFFGLQLLSYFENMPNMNIDSGGEILFIYQLDHLEPIENLNQFVSTKIQIFNDICRYSYR